MIDEEMTKAFFLNTLSHDFEHDFKTLMYLETTAKVETNFASAFI